MRAPVDDVVNADVAHGREAVGAHVWASVLVSLARGHIGSGTVARDGAVVAVMRLVVGVPRRLRYVVLGKPAMLAVATVNGLITKASAPEIGLAELSAVPKMQRADSMSMARMIPKTTP